MRGGLGLIGRICELRHSLRPARRLNSTQPLAPLREGTGGSVMTQEAAAETQVPTPRERPDPFGVTLLAAIGIVMLVWIGGLVWGTMAFFNWLVS
jgi:hypothetical protein